MAKMKFQALTRFRTDSLGWVAPGQVVELEEAEGREHVQDGRMTDKIKKGPPANKATGPESNKGRESEADYFPGRGNGEGAAAAGAGKAAGKGRPKAAG